MVSVSINMMLNAEYRKDIGKTKIGLMKWILINGFSGIINSGWVEDQKMMKDKLIDGKNESRFRGTLVKMIKDASSKFDDY